MLRWGKKDHRPSATGRNTAAALLRVKKDINELSLPDSCNIEFPDADDLLNFSLIMMPDEGYYFGGRFEFKVEISAEYPLAPPKVNCQTKVYHPNINLEGAVCLNILREEWRPVLNINAVIYGLLHIFLEPNVKEPLNKEAANELLSSPETFRAKVKRTIRGGVVNGIKYPGCMAYQQL